MSVVFSRRGFVLAGTALGLAGCATMPVLTAAAPGETFTELEPLLAVEARPDALVIRVTSKGCATKADFVFHVDRQRGRAVVAFARRRLETCKGPAGTLELRFGYDELGLTRGERIIIANPISPSA
ncbi:hypothetical protein [Caulobacter sp. RL271]|jgi:hypothetical protein|uniref:Lipoprotein n=1 Tax=Caulobacter segnis TaxID=88688 RepID=A0ABY4ZXW4_9CAUL|nr:hypothetical protein [Caulobacter segnis]USQ97535.1 hypothetical protein MZV50_08355 [Caulobacter segnis]